MSGDRILIKIQRAKEHLGELATEINSFFEANPYVVGTKRNSETRQLIYYLVTVQDVPDRIAAIAGEVLQNLRSALDHLAYALFMVGPGGASGNSAKHVYFPICDDAARYAAESPGKVKGMRQDAIDKISALRPYKGGNDTLWILNKLNNVDKHRFVIMVGSAFRSMDLGAHLFDLMAKQAPALAQIEPIHAFIRPADRKFPLKTGNELFIDGPDAKENPKSEFRFEIAFGEAGIIEGEPLMETLKAMTDVVDSLVHDFAPLLS